MKKKLFVTALALIMILGSGSNSVADASNFVRWEYKVVDAENLQSLRAAEDLEDFLNSFGSDGWEIATFEVFNSGNLIFKRPDLRTEAERAEGEERARAESEERARIEEERQSIRTRGENIISNFEAFKEASGRVYSQSIQQNETFNLTLESLSAFVGDSPRARSLTAEQILETPSKYVVEQINGFWFIGYSMGIGQETTGVVEHLKERAREPYRRLLGNIELYVESYVDRGFSFFDFDQNSLYDGQDVVYIDITPFGSRTTEPTQNPIF